MKTKWLFNICLGTLLMAAGLFVIAGCEKDDPVDNSIRVDSFGPSPVLRGGELTFIGNRLDEVSAVVLANGVEVTTFVSKDKETFKIVVPEATVSGPVLLKTPSGDINTKTHLTISEPIAITSFSPSPIKPGATLTINGTYLNLVEEVIFKDKVSVTSFVSHTQSKIEVVVPENAQTGFIVVSNGEANPILVESETELVVTIPTITAFTPNPVKAGTEVKLTGTDLDLVKTVTFGGGVNVTSFVSATPGELTVVVPANAQDGEVKATVASGVQVTSSGSLTMLLPTITNMTPNPVKNGAGLMVSGENLDLVTSVTFGGDKVGSIVSAIPNSLIVSVPLDAVAGQVVFGTAANKSVMSSANLDLVVPVVSNMGPTSAMFGEIITFTGSDLDLLVTARFSGGTEAPVTVIDASNATAEVPVGTLTGPVSLVTTNGTVIASSADLTILASTSAVITNMPSKAKPGEMINIEGENLDEVTTVIFPDGVAATMYGAKTESLIQVVVPADVKRGIGTLTLITSIGEMVTSPEINIQGVDDVADPSLVFFDFDNLNRWWGDTGANENDPAITLDGSMYFRVNGSLNGWTGFFWRNGKDNFPADAIGANASNYVLKFDINVIDPITGGEFAWRFKGGGQDYWHYWKPWETEGPYTTNGWITVSIPLDEFYSGGSPLTDLSIINEDFGVAFNNGSSAVNAAFDNIRFELK